LHASAFACRARSGSASLKNRLHAYKAAPVPQPRHILHVVMPAQAGIQNGLIELDSRFLRG
jgi:hypothetical protein